MEPASDTKSLKKEQLSSLTICKLQAAEGKRQYKATFISAGRVRDRANKDSNWEIPAQTIIEAVNAGKLDAKAVFVDHTTWLDDYPHLDRMIGVTSDTVWDAESQSAEGIITLYETPLAVAMSSIWDTIIADNAVPDVGFSLTFIGRHDYQDIGQEPGDEYLMITTEIVFVHSVDNVFMPGTRKARLKEILSSYQIGEVIPPIKGEIEMDKYCSKCGATLEEGHTCVVEQVQETLAAAPAIQQVAQQPKPEQSDPAMDRLATIESNLTRLTQLMINQADSGLVKGMGNPAQDVKNKSSITGLSTWEMVEQAYDRLMGLPVQGQTYHLTGIRELYVMLTGDRNFIGRYNPDEVLVRLAYNPAGNNADTTSMAELTRNVMNKMLIEQVGLLQEYQWWRRIVRVENFTTLQQASFVRLGGIGDLPTVAEKAEYTQLLWDDARTTADWVKKGGYLPLSLEMIDRDDLVGWRDVPRQLAWAAVVTLSSIVSNLFTDNAGAGPSITTEGITDNLFSAAFGNVIGQPLDQTNWGLAVETMYKLAQFNVAGRRQGVRPKFVLVPIELESSGITAVSTPVVVGSLADRQPQKRLLPEDNVITVPHWTNPSNWAAVADPAMVPIAGVGFRFGETPELFTAADANSFLMFFNDVLPIKVRYFFAVAAIDPRGAIKSNL